MERVQEYIVGNGKAPWWCRRLLMHYLKPNGEVGVEFHGYTKDYELEIGDRIMRHGNRIIVKRRGAVL